VEKFSENFPPHCVMRNPPNTSEHDKCFAIGHYIPVFISRRRWSLWAKWLQNHISKSW